MGVELRLGDVRFTGPCKDCDAPLDSRGIHATGSCPNKSASTQRHHAIANSIAQYSHEAGLMPRDSSIHRSHAYHRGLVPLIDVALLMFALDCLTTPA